MYFSRRPLTFVVICIMHHALCATKEGEGEVERNMHANAGYASCRINDACTAGQ